MDSTKVYYSYKFLCYENLSVSTSYSFLDPEKITKKKKLFLISFVGENVQYNLLMLRYTMESKIVFKKKHDEIHGKKMKCICD